MQELRWTRIEFEVDKTITHQKKHKLDGQHGIEKYKAYISYLNITSIPFLFRLTTTYAFLGLTTAYL
jgi:hypothetical protein